MSEFNILAVMPQELQLRLATLAAHGGGVTSIFGAAQAQRAKVTEEKERAQHQVLIDAVMATPERLAAFELELTRLDEASTAALLENEEKLRKAEEDLARIRKQGFPVALPDGKKVAVYRDGNDVRTEDGTLIDFMKADDLPAGTPEVSEVRDAFGRVNAIIDKRKEIMAFRDDLAEGQERLAQGSMTQDEFDDLKARFESLPDSVREQRDRIAAEEGTAQDQTTGAFEKPDAALAARVKPARDFKAAGAGISADDFAGLPESELPVNAPSPAASVPAPK